MSPARAAAAVVAALLTAAGVVMAPLPAAAVAPPTELHLTLSSSQARAGEPVEIAASASIPDGTPAAGRIELRLDGAAGSVLLHAAAVSGTAPVRTTLTPAPGRYTVVARFTPTRAIDQTAAEASAPLRANGAADLQVRWPVLVAGHGAAVEAIVRTTTSAPDLGGSVRLEWDEVAAFASCSLQALSTTVGECELLLPATITAGTHPVNVVWTGDDRFADANATAKVTVEAAPAASRAEPSGSVTAGTSTGTGVPARGAAGPAPAASPAPTGAAVVAGALPGADRPLMPDAGAVQPGAPAVPLLPVIGITAAAAGAAAVIALLLLRGRRERRRT